MDKATQQLKTVWVNLPVKLKEYIRSDEWWRQLNIVWANYPLTEEQKEKTSDEVLLTLLGLTDQNDLSIAIQTTAGLSAEQAGHLALDLETTVFAPVNDELAELNPLSVDDYRSGLMEIDPAIAKLPQDLQQIILSTDTAEAIQNIGQKYNLHIDQMGGLDDEVGAVMVGETKPDEFVDKIKNRLQVDQPAAEAISREVNEQIFLPIRESLRKLHEQPESKEVIGGVETIQTPKPPTALGTDDLPDKDKLLGEIEKPAAAKTETETIFEKKLGQLFRIPREEVDLDPYLEKPE